MKIVHIPIVPRGHRNRMDVVVYAVLLAHLYLGIETSNEETKKHVSNQFLRRLRKCRYTRSKIFSNQNNFFYFFNFWKQTCVLITHKSLLNNIGHVFFRFFKKKFPDDLHAAQCTVQYITLSRELLMNILKIQLFSD